MRFSIFITTKTAISGNNWYYRKGAFILREDKIGADFMPDNFDTIEAARSKIAELKANGEDRCIYIKVHGNE